MGSDIGHMTVGVTTNRDFKNVSINTDDDVEIEDVVVPELICSYLIHSGYEKAAASFQKSWSSQKCGGKPDVSSNLKSIKHRKSNTANFIQDIN